MKPTADSPDRQQIKETIEHAEASLQPMFSNLNKFGALEAMVASVAGSSALLKVSYRAGEFMATYQPEIQAFFGEVGYSAMQLGNAGAALFGPTMFAYRVGKAVYEYNIKEKTKA